MSLPLNLPSGQMQTKWKSEIDPILNNPLNGVSVLSNIQLRNGVTIINHLLGRTQQGWFLVDIQSAATIYRSAPFNDQTLILTSNAAAIASIGVF